MNKLPKFLSSTIKTIIYI